MQTEMIPYSITFAILGLISIGLGLWLTLGINRYWWQWRILPFQEGYFWAGIPGGMAMILLALAAVFPRGSIIQTILFCSSMIFVVIAIIFSLGPPNIVKPKWLRELEKKHPYQIKQLRECARNMDTDTWQEIVFDPERLQQWANEEVHEIKVTHQS